MILHIAIWTPIFPLCYWTSTRSHFSSV